MTGLTNGEEISSAAAAISNHCGDAKHPRNAADSVSVVLTKLSDIPPSSLEWIVKGWLPKGKFTVIAGEPSVGKTMLALALIALISRGGLFADGTQCEKGSVLLWSSEDDFADTIKPRLMAMGAALENVHRIGGGDQHGQKVAFDPSVGFPALLGEARRIGNVRLIVIDPIYITGGSNEKVRRALDSALGVATELGAALVGITHLGKVKAGRGPLDRVLGSIAYVAMARTVLICARAVDANGNVVRRVVRAKSNFGCDHGGFDYSIVEAQPQPGLVSSALEWGQFLEGDADTLLQSMTNEGQATTNQLGQAAQALQTVLAAGPMQCGQAIAQMEALSISKKRTLKAHKELGCISSDGGTFPRTTVWALPQHGGTSDPARDGVKHGALECVDAKLGLPDAQETASTLDAASAQLPARVGDDETCDVSTSCTEVLHETAPPTLNAMHSEADCEIPCFKPAENIGDLKMRVEDWRKEGKTLVAADLQRRVRKSRSGVFGVSVPEVMGHHGGGSAMTSAGDTREPLEVVVWVEGQRSIVVAVVPEGGNPEQFAEGCNAGWLRTGAGIKPRNRTNKFHVLGLENTWVDNLWGPPAHPVATLDGLWA